MKKHFTTIFFPLAVCLFVLALTSCFPSRDCVDVNESCSEDSDCCHYHCEGGSCCRGIGADLSYSDPPSDCCSGRIRTNERTGPYCCGTAGMEVSSADRCCEGLGWNPATGECAVPDCPPDCTWNDADVVGGGECVCDDDVTVPEIPCSPCDNLSEPDCWFYRVYHEGYTSSGDPSGDGCRLAGPFWAPDEATAEDCASREVADRGLTADIPWVVEDISDIPGQECLVP